MMAVMVPSESISCCRRDLILCLPELPVSGEVVSCRAVVVGRVA